MKDTMVLYKVRQSSNFGSLRSRKIQIWRSFDVPPPKIDPKDEYSQVGDRRYADVDPAVVPLTESLALVIDRLLPYWQDEIAGDLLAGKVVFNCCSR